MTENSHIEEKSIDIFFLLSIIFRYRWFIVITTGGCAVVVFLFTLITAILPPEISPLPDTYRATTLLLVDEEMSGDLMATFSWWEKNVMAGKFPTSFSHGELAIKLLMSNTVIDAIAEEYALGTYYGTSAQKGARVRHQVRRRLLMKYEEKTMTLTIAYEDNNPEMAYKITNRFVEALKEMFASIGERRGRAKMNLLEEKLSDVNSKITEMEAKVEEFQSTYGVLDVDNLAVEKSTIMANLRSQLFLKEMELKTYTQFSTIEDPVVMKLRAERNNLLKLIREMESGFSAYQDVLPAQKELPAIATEYSHLKRDLLVQEKIYEALIQEYELVKLSLEGEETLFQVIEYAEIPEVKVGPHRMLICTMTTFIVFIVSTFLAFIFYWIRKNKDEFLNIINSNQENTRKKKRRV
jgi:tyrosine-protein kinase Etk/Wzc